MLALAAYLNSKEFSKLIIKGKDKNYLTAEEINDSIPAGIVDPDQIDTIIMKIQEARIEIVADNTDYVDEEGIRLDGSELIEEALSREEQAELRSASTDPVKLYLKKMGQVSLLTREGEVEIAKQIEEGEREIILSSLTSTHALKEILKLREKIESAEEQQEYVKDLVRGLDDESTPQEIKETKDRIYATIDDVQKYLSAYEQEDGTLKQQDEKGKKEFEKISQIKNRFRKIQGGGAVDPPPF